MTRIGSFSGPAVSFGVPLQLVHPPDNRFPRFDPEIEALNISDEEKQKLQDQAEGLFGALVVARDQQP